MKRLKLIILILALGSIANCGSSESYKFGDLLKSNSVVFSESNFSDKLMVYNAYIFASIFPERFEAYAQEYIIPYKREFISCVRNIQLTINQRWIHETERCKGISNYMAKRMCYETEESKVSFFLDSIIAALDGRPFANSIHGQAIVLSKSLLGQEYIELNKLVLPTLKPILICN